MFSGTYALQNYRTDSKREDEYRTSAAYHEVHPILRTQQQEQTRAFPLVDCKCMCYCLCFFINFNIDSSNCLKFWFFKILLTY